MTRRPDVIALSTIAETFAVRRVVALHEPLLFGRRNERVAADQARGLESERLRSTSSRLTVDATSGARKTAARSRAMASAPAS